MKKRRWALLCVLVLVVMSIGGCGSTYKCSRCGEKTRDAYYDPFREDSYFCEPCAREYFAPFPYSAYKVD